MREVVAPNVASARVETQRLAFALKSLARTAGARDVEPSRSAWKRVALAWRKASAFRAGPMVENNALLRATFAPIRGNVIERELTGTRRIDGTLLSELGAGAKGVFALEYLLFEASEGGSVPVTAEGARGERARSLAEALSAELESYAEGIGRGLGEQGELFGPKFASTMQQSMSSLVSQLVENVETLLTSRYQLLLAMEPAQALRPSDLEGLRSRMSHELAQALLSGTEKLYRGGESGALAALVRQTAPDVARRVNTRFDEALRSVRAIREPLERAVLMQRTAVEAVASRLRTLERALKLELGAALGVTLTFTSFDGD